MFVPTTGVPMEPIASQPPFERTLTVGGRSFRYASLDALPESRRLPVCLKILLENVIRRAPSEDEARRRAQTVIEAGLAGRAGAEIEFMPARVLFQDFTGVPVFCDFAAMRDAAAERGEDPAKVNPLIPCTLVIDHSVTADVVSCPEAAQENARIEAERNAERFAFLKWAAESFDNVEIVPPGVGICHQLNVERFCRVVWTDASDASAPLVYFDTLVGTDSHTPTANGLGVLGWGVGGIEAEAAALGQPVTMTVPPVVGVRLTGALRSETSGMDVALAFAERLRKEGVVGCLLEVTGPGAETLSVTQRTTIANMTPEYGATATFFPADDATFAQLECFGRSPEEVELARAYLAAQGMLDADDGIVYQRIIEIDLSGVEPSLAGPSRPHDRVPISRLRERFRGALAEAGREPGAAFTTSLDGMPCEVRHGAIAIAAVTSCTTATDPAMMVAAGLVARRAADLGCTVPPWVKTVFAPGSHATTALLARLGLIEPLAELGFAVCGWGCMSCIGNSGPVFPGIEAIAGECELTSVLSGNRNFEGRISPHVAQNYLCAPALVIAYALAGTMDIDLSRQAVCDGAAGPVYLSDLLPSDEEVVNALARADLADVYARTAREPMCGSSRWQALAAPEGAAYRWDPASTYVRRPTFLDGRRAVPVFSVEGARALVYLGDFVTTDHISPAGAIAPDGPAARYLRENGVDDASFNSFGARRGNHEVMMRGTFANVRLDNRLAAGRRGGWTLDPVTGDITSVFDAAMSARDAGIPLIVLAGKMYGSGSSRDWAAKGPQLLGVRAVIAESFERIHRSNLIGMGIVPLAFKPGDTAPALGLVGDESFTIEPIELCSLGQRLVETRVVACGPDGRRVDFLVDVRVDTPAEGAYLAAGGILPFVLDNVLA